MVASSFTIADASRTAPVWVESMGGPLIAVGDNGVQALVLADEPAASCCLPERRAPLRWLAADSEAGLKAAAEAVLADPATEGAECGTWVSDGPAVLMDSVEEGCELGIEYSGGGKPGHVLVALPAGRWRVRATGTKADEESGGGLVQILPTMASVPKDQGDSPVIGAVLDGSDAVIATASPGSSHV
ncbi:Imm21 family immunity protein [Streptomyces sp. NPDC049585]|uniref:Imm21 family immunity protein n=1 Tax=Streptomyces sp. NPDC049585 TaxID=3155154 RepID=UPI003449F1D7